MGACGAYAARATKPGRWIGSDPRILPSFFETVNGIDRMSNGIPAANEKYEIERRSQDFSLLCNHYPLPSTYPNTRRHLMSATLNNLMFLNIFQNCCQLHRHHTSPF